MTNSPEPPILIYQMGKVASQSIAEALFSQHYPAPVVRLHFASDHSIMAQQERLKQYPEFHDRASVQNQIQCAFRARKALAGSKRVKIIAGVREPVSREVASFFQNLQTILGKRWRRTTSGEQIREDLMEAIHDRWEDYPIGGTWPAARWFDHEFKPVTGIDVYEYPFDHDRGYLILRLERVDLLIYKLENGAETIEQGLGDFFNISGFQLRKVNAAETKSYSSYYKKFINTVDISSDILNSAYDSKYVKHFYRPQEILEFQKKWKNFSQRDLR